MKTLNLLIPQDRGHRKQENPPLGTTGSTMADMRGQWTPRCLTAVAFVGSVVLSVVAGREVERDFGFAGPREGLQRALKTC